MYPLLCVIIASAPLSITLVAPDDVRLRNCWLRVPRNLLFGVTFFFIGCANLAIYAPSAFRMAFQCLFEPSLAYLVLAVTSGLYALAALKVMKVAFRHLAAG